MKVRYAISWPSWTPPVRTVTVPWLVPDGLGGVHDQVHDHLAHLAGIRVDERSFVAALVIQDDLLGDRDPEQVPHSGHQLVQVQQFGSVHSPAGVDQHLVGQLRRSLRGQLDLLDRFPVGSVRLDVHQRQIGVPEDDHQEVVEVVGDPPGQDPKALESLRVLHAEFELAPFLLGALAITDVRGDDRHPDDPSVALERPDAALQGNGDTERARNDLIGHRLTRREGPVEGILRGWPVFRQHVVDHTRPDHRLGRNPGKRPVHVRDLAVKIRSQNDPRSVLQDRATPLFTLAERLQLRVQPLPGLTATLRHLSPSGLESALSHVSPGSFKRLEQNRDLPAWNLAPSRGWRGDAWGGTGL